MVHVPVLPRLPPPSLPPLTSATLCVSGQSSLTVGSAGLCGGLFILERGLPSGSLHLSKHPPRPLLCVPGLTQPPPSTPHHLISNRLLCLTPSFLLYHFFIPLSNLFFYFPSLPCALSFFLYLDFFFSTVDSVLSWMRKKAGRHGLGKKISALVYRRLYDIKQLYSWLWLPWMKNNSTHL